MDIEVKSANSAPKLSGAAIRRSGGERAFDIFNVVGMILLGIVMVYPFYYVLIIAFNSPTDTAAAPLWLFPRKLTLVNFETVLQYPGLSRAFLITTLRCLAAPLYSVSVCFMAAYALSNRQLPWRRFIVFFLLLPTFIGGSMVSTYIVIARLKLINTFWVFVLPGAFAYFTSVVMRASLDNLPAELQESAMLDGANYYRIFFQIMLPLSKSVLAAFFFFAVVSNWLDLNSSLFYITKKNLYTLQYIMHLVLKSNEAASIIDHNSQSMDLLLEDMERMREKPTPLSVRMAITALVTFPILFIYPFFQRYFVKGMLTGAVKA
ncbi:MAG: carbohydrate ABC transporter permease [Christensenellaceae bacterium]|jgi:putative aldouronate transport system permease protein|nr:carbohydrate ABC transporter permease [Christensenellaceae bacterium]